MNIHAYHAKYERWWLYKRCRANSLEPFRRVIRIEVIGPLSFVYGSVRLYFEDGTKTFVGKSDACRPLKKDVEVEEWQGEKIMIDAALEFVQERKRLNSRIIKLEAENQVLREQNFEMNKSLVKLRSVLEKIKRSTKGYIYQIAEQALKGEWLR